MLRVSSFVQLSRRCFEAFERTIRNVTITVSMIPFVVWDLDGGQDESSRRIVSALIWPSLDYTSYKRVQFSRSDTNVFFVLRKNRVRVWKILGNRNCRNNKRRILEFSEQVTRLGRVEEDGSLPVYKVTRS